MLEGSEALSSVLSASTAELIAVALFGVRFFETLHGTAGQENGLVGWHLGLAAIACVSFEQFECRKWRRVGACRVSNAV